MPICKDLQTQKNKVAEVLGARQRKHSLQPLRAANFCNFSSPGAIAILERRMVISGDAMCLIGFERRVADIWKVRYG
jgi:hypothetical protein